MTMERLPSVSGIPNTTATLLETAEMKRNAISIVTAAAFTTLLFAAGCSDDGPAKEAGESVDEAVEEAGDEVEEATD